MNFNKPTLLIDAQKCLANLQRVKTKAEKHGLIFRPHFKTHQSAQIGKWFGEPGVQKITVSSVTMAQYFAQHGWNDITIAFPLNFAQIDEIETLAVKININILVENNESVDFLSARLKHPIGVFIKIDAGYHRTGINVEDHQIILRLIQKISKQSLLHFHGFVVHNGHTYHAHDASEILEIHNQSLEKLTRLKIFMKQNGINPMISIGDTPSVSVADNFENVDEIRPGNFIFYDVMQQNLGACQFSDIAVVLACPVVAKHPERMEVVIYGGAIHLSKDSIINSEGNKSFGLVVKLTENGWSAPWPETYVCSLSQEHGIIRTIPKIFDNINVGDFLGILPVHSCLTTHLMKELHTIDGACIKTMNA